MEPPCSGRFMRIIWLTTWDGLLMLNKCQIDQIAWVYPNPTTSEDRIYTQQIAIF